MLGKRLLFLMRYSSQLGDIQSFKYMVALLLLAMPLLVVSDI